MNPSIYEGVFFYRNTYRQIRIEGKATKRKRNWCWKGGKANRIYYDSRCRIPINPSDGSSHTAYRELLDLTVGCLVALSKNIEQYLKDQSNQISLEKAYLIELQHIYKKHLQPASINFILDLEKEDRGIEKEHQP